MTEKWIVKEIHLLYRNNTPDNSRLESLAIGFTGSALLEMIVGIIGQRKFLSQRKRERHKAISDAVNAKLAEIDSQSD